MDIPDWVPVLGEHSDHRRLGEQDDLENGFDLQAWLGDIGSTESDGSPTLLPAIDPSNVITAVPVLVVLLIVVSALSVNGLSMFMTANNIAGAGQPQGGTPGGATPAATEGTPSTASPTASPTATATPTASATASPTSTSTASPTATATATPTSMPTPTAPTTSTPTATDTQPTTSTATSTATPTDQLTPIVTVQAPGESNGLLSGLAEGFPRFGFLLLGVVAVLRR